MVWQSSWFSQFKVSGLWEKKQRGKTLKYFSLSHSLQSIRDPLKKSSCRPRDTDNCNDNDRYVDNDKRGTRFVWFFSLLDTTHQLWWHYDNISHQHMLISKMRFDYFHKASISGRSVFFDETAEYKWWVWVLDWWVLIIMHISPSLKRACTPPGQTAVLCCPQQVFIPAPRNLTIYPQRIFGCPAFFYNHGEIMFLLMRPTIVAVFSDNINYKKWLDKPILVD